MLLIYKGVNMFNPQELPNIKAEYHAILDLSNLNLESNVSTDIYICYFSILQKIEQLKVFKEKVIEDQAQSRAYLTHNNPDLRNISYNCYRALQNMTDSFSKNLTDLENIKVDIIEKFHSNFEQNQGA